MQFAHLWWDILENWPWWPWRHDTKYCRVKAFKKCLFHYFVEKDIFWGKFVSCDAKKDIRSQIRNLRNIWKVQANFDGNLAKPFDWNLAKKLSYCRNNIIIGLRNFWNDLKMIQNEVNNYILTLSVPWKDAWGLWKAKHMQVRTCHFLEKRSLVTVTVEVV